MAGKKALEHNNVTNEIMPVVLWFSTRLGDDYDTLRCGFLLSSPDFRLHACEFFKLVSSRKRPVDETASDFDSAVSSIVQILMNASREFLYKSASNAGAIDDAEFEFSESLCESLVSLGCWNLQSISSDENILLPYSCAAEAGEPIMQYGQSIVDGETTQGQIPGLLDIVLYLCEKDHTEGGMIFQLLEDLTELSTMRNCKDNFGFIESKQDFILDW